MQDTLTLTWSGQDREFTPLQKADVKCYHSNEITLYQEYDHWCAHVLIFSNSYASRAGTPQEAISLLENKIKEMAEKMLSV
jgi:hypothetical protein